ncbi:Sporulation kinase E [Planctomycetes bacterium K2D]|uniref:histidine kinase n=2 Tax=Botrimarina mediterranea TaxID=2528022 RepID=A0A518K8K2_9BACT|nr:Sporulation kinase E [Botrimarina mediterranea]QDV78727.1 Sporulation kinase E [Planctomycetes bacterium K2D]
MTSRCKSRMPLALFAAAVIGIAFSSVMGGESGVLLSDRGALESAIQYHEAVVGEVLLIDSGSRWNFDTLANLERGLRSQIDKIESQEHRYTPTDLPGMLRDDLELVERYKTHHAVRRKSLAVLADPNRTHVVFPDRFAGEIAWLVMRLSGQLDGEAADKIGKVLEEDRWREAQYAEAKAHLHLIVQSQTRCDAILSRLTDSPARARMLQASDRLRDLIESHTDSLNTRQRLIFVLLAATLGYAGAMLVEQRRAVHELAKVNDGLETAVADRTAELTAERELLRSLLDSLPSAVFWKDLEGVYRGCNPAFASILGFDCHERVIGITDDDLPWDFQSRCNKIETERAVLTSHHAVIGAPDCKVLESGRSLELIASTLILRDQQSQPWGLVGVYTDVSELNRLRRELVQAEKLRSVGQLAAGIAHEINSPIQTASGNIEYLKEGLATLLTVAEVGVAESLSVRPTIDPHYLDHLRRNAYGAVEDCSEALRRVTEIVQSMRVMSHPGKREHVATDLNAIVGSAVTITRSRWKYHAEVEIDIDDDLPMPEVMSNEISQVLLNLIVNAGDAIAEARSEDDPLGLITVRTRSDSDHVVVEVEDTGCGMPPELRSRIFEPFFTTKEVGKGTGQGLAIAHDIVVLGHGGQIECESEAGVGTTFRLYLPVTAESTTPREVLIAN